MVAHRILTVIDCHQILVMADGKIIEAGHPHELLTKYGDSSLAEEDDEDSGTATAVRGQSNATIDSPPKNSFAAMVQQLGPTMDKKLRHLAAVAWQEQQQ